MTWLIKKMRGKREHQSKETLRFKELYGMMMKKLEIECEESDDD